MNQKKLWRSLIIVCFVFLILPGQSGAEEIELQLTQGQSNPCSQMSFGLRLMGGASLLMQNDLNDHIQGLNDNYDDLSSSVPSLIVDSEYEPIKMGLDFSGEILINFMPHFSIGIGAGYISAGKESSIEISYTSMIGSQEFTMSPQISAIPITLSLYYGIPVGNGMEVVLNGGAGYYLGTINYEMAQISTSMGTYEYTEDWNAQSNALGFHGGLNLEFGFSSNMAFVVGARGRLVKFTDLSGDLEWEYSDSWGWSDSGTEKDQTLWFGQFESLYTGIEYPRLAISDTKPAGFWWSDVRKAEINLSGIVFQAGIKLTF
ncbi:MAG: hypothetical protein GF421_10715 [Candidatus Aminicenantes bacterium]|nr:hypothetical protein [Candidatus Aminicenantes bacterium]